MDDTRASFSNYGPCLDLFAPGDNIASSLVTGDYGLMSGTSMAAPLVAGVVAMLRQVRVDGGCVSRVCRVCCVRLCACVCRGCVVCAVCISVPVCVVCAVCVSVPVCDMCV